MSSHLSNPPRRSFNARQRETAERLLEAGEAELRDVGVEALTVRTVAQRAGVSPATAYTYLSSKNHLFAELFLRALTGADLARAEAPDGTPAGRLRAFHQRMADLLATNPHLAHAANVALLSTDPEVERLRLRIGAEFARAYAAALGEEERDPAVLDTLLLAFSGALLQTGMGLIAYGDLVERLDGVARVVLGGDAR